MYIAPIYDSWYNSFLSFIFLYLNESHNVLIMNIKQTESIYIRQRNYCVIVENDLTLHRKIKNKSKTNSNQILVIRFD